MFWKWPSVLAREPEGAWMRNWARATKFGMPGGRPSLGDGLALALELAALPSLELGLAAFRLACGTLKASPSGPGDAMRLEPASAEGFSALGDASGCEPSWFDVARLIVEVGLRSEWVERAAGRGRASSRRAGCHSLLRELESRSPSWKSNASRSRGPFKLL